MEFVYFTKTLANLDGMGLLEFVQSVGIQGVDLAVRPGYFINPDNARKELPLFAQFFREHGLMVGLVSSPTTMIDPESRLSRTIFDACGEAKIPAIKIGYFPYKGKFEQGLQQARSQLKKFAELAARTGVKMYYHTHSGNNFGNNGAGLRGLLQDFDPHHVAAFVDTGHTAVNGGPIGMELDIVRPWFSALAVKDMLWKNTKDGWRHEVVPAGTGIVQWNEVARSLKDTHFRGIVSLHGEYECTNLEEKKLARQELLFLRKQFTV